MASISNIVFICILLLIGLVFGKAAERRHLKSIMKREHQLNALPAIASRYPPTGDDVGPHRQMLVTGNVVIASDYFKTFLSGLINIFGGRVTPFESLLDRGRREAMLRMKSSAQALNADFIFNVKYQTATIEQKAGGAVEVLAYGTALIPMHPSTNPTNLNGVST